MVKKHRTLHGTHQMWKVMQDPVRGADVQGLCVWGEMCVSIEECALVSMWLREVKYKNINIKINLGDWQT